MDNANKVVRLKTILVVGSIILVFLLWASASFRGHYTFRDRCSAVVLPLELVSGMSEADLASLLDAHDCNIDKKRELFGEPCQVTEYRCRSYCFRGHGYPVVFVFLRGRLMSVEIAYDDDQSIGIGCINERMLKRERVGNIVRYSDAGMEEEVARYWQDYL